MAEGVRFRLARRVSRRLYYGWIVIGVVFAANLMAFNINPTFGLFVVPLEAEFGWDRGTIARSLTFGTIIGAALSPLLGYLLDRFGVRRLMVLFGVLTAVCYASLGGVQEAWQYNILLGLVFALGTNGVGQMMGSVTISRWFVRRRGRAMGIIMMGASTGALVFIPLYTVLIASAGWRFTYLVSALAVLGLISLPALLLMVDVPERIGLAEHTELRGGPSGNGATRHEVAYTLGEAGRTRAFWLTLLGIMLGAFPVQGYFVHAVPHMEAAGFSRALASTVWTTFFFTGIGAKFAWGFVIERIGVRWSMVALWLFEALGMLLLVTARTPTALFVFAVVNGLGHGPYLQLQAMVWADYFGRRAIGRIYGTVQPAIVIAGSLGPWFGGLVYDVTGDYQTFFHIGIAMSLMAALVFALDAPPAHRAVGTAAPAQSGPA